MPESHADIRRPGAPCDFVSETSHPGNTACGERLPWPQRRVGSHRGLGRVRAFDAKLGVRDPARLTGACTGMRCRGAAGVAKNWQSGVGIYFSIDA